MGTLSLCLSVVTTFVLMTSLTDGAGTLYGDWSGTQLHRNDDGYSGAQSIPTFRYFGQTYSSCYVCTNGVISFTRGLSSYTPRAFPASSLPVIAPFWADVDIRSSGAIHYKQQNNQAIKNELQRDIHAFDPAVAAAGFRVEHAYVVTWSNVPAYPGRGSGNTFQAIMAYNSQFSFVVYSYSSMTWTYGSASGGVSGQVGFDAGNRQNYAQHPDSRTSAIGHIENRDGNSGYVGRWIFRVDQTEIVVAPVCPAGCSACSGNTCSACLSGYFLSGSSCVLNHCNGVNCNGGSCRISGNGYVCDCAANRLGTHCETTNHCYGQNCNGRGSCSNNANGFTCNCHTGYTGTTCTACATSPVNYIQTSSNPFTCVINYCHQQTCSGRGTCINGNGYTCQCQTGYVGTDCEQCQYNYRRVGSECLFNYCYQRDCSGGRGECTSNYVEGRHNCACDRAYAGTDCETCAVDYELVPGTTTAECRENHCYNAAEQDSRRQCSYHGFCENAASATFGTTYTCHCNQGYRGQDCSECSSGYTRVENSNTECQIDYCLNQNCHGSGTCQLGSNRYTCNCDEGYTQASDCRVCENGYFEDDNGNCLLNPCLIRNPCGNHGSCEPIDAEDFTCTCENGYQGRLCDSCLEDWMWNTERTMCIQNFCYTHQCSELGGVCVNGVERATCNCNLGYSLGVSGLCTDCAAGYEQMSNGRCRYDFCASNPCGTNGICTNGEERPTCECTPAGAYYGAECDEQNHCYGRTCSGHGECFNEPEANTYRCSCDEHFYGENCEYENTCSSQGVDCQNGGSCEDQAGTGTYRCTCTGNFVGRHCDSCRRQYIGSDCQTLDSCIGSQCQNGGSCINEADDGYRCACTYGYVGRYCIERNMCDYLGVTCDNGGTCNDDGVCECNEGYAGERCESCAVEFTPDPNSETFSCVDDHCHNHDCLNGATCDNRPSDRDCVCPRSNDLGYFLGDRCETRDACVEENVLCVNGNCRNLGTSGFVCDCDGNYEGTFCEDCIPGWRGDNCELVDNCHENQACQNGGTCVNDPGAESGFVCLCDVQNWIGPYCDIENFCGREETARRFCQNGATCENLQDTFRCVCVHDNYAGTYCEGCAPGYLGEDCTTADSCYPDPCDHGTCNRLSETNSECICEENYIGDNCETYDICEVAFEARDREQCRNNAPCVNELIEDLWEWRCDCDQYHSGEYCNECAEGWTDEDEECRVVDHCYGVNQLGICGEFDCINMPDDDNLYACECNNDPDLLGPDCTGSSICETCGLGMDREAQCVYEANSWRCQCSSDLRFSGDSCDECTSVYVGDECDVISRCQQNPCLNRATCVTLEEEERYSCQCHNNYLGDLCQIVDQCVAEGGDLNCQASFDRPCITMSDDDSGANAYYVCDFCDPDTCLNGGTCNNLYENRTVSCTCPYIDHLLHYSGDRCQEIRICNDERCLNGGTCVVDEGDEQGYNCTCAEGWGGKACQFVDNCVDYTCPDGGECVTTGEDPEDRECEGMSDQDALGDTNAQNAGGMDPLLIGSIGGAALLLALLCLIVYCCIKKGGKKRDEKDEDEEHRNIFAQRTPSPSDTDDGRNTAQTARDIHLDDNVDYEWA